MVRSHSTQGGFVKDPIGLQSKLATLVGRPFSQLPTKNLVEIN